MMIREVKLAASLLFQINNILQIQPSVVTWQGFKESFVVHLNILDFGRAKGNNRTKLDNLSGNSNSSGMGEEGVPQEELGPCTRFGDLLIMFSPSNPEMGMKGIFSGL